MRSLPLAVALSSAAVYGFSPQNLPVDAATMLPYEAHAISVTGNVSRVRDAHPWAVSTGEQVPVHQIISTGEDGFAHFTVAGGSWFDVFSNSRIVFRQNTARAGDLLDLLGGRVKVHLQPNASQPQQRVFTPTAIIFADQPATFALALDEDDTLRLDVIEGDVRVQHAKLPKSEPTLVHAIDAILVRPDEPITRRVDRGSLYRYTIKPFKDLWLAVTPGHSASHNGDVIEAEKVLAQASPANHLLSYGTKASF
jgi:hypothetical protein